MILNTTSLISIAVAVAAAAVIAAVLAAAVAVELFSFSFNCDRQYSGVVPVVENLNCVASSFSEF